MVGMRERLGGRLPPRTRFGERRVRRRSRGDEVDIDGLIAVDHQLDMANKLLIRQLGRNGEIAAGTQVTQMASTAQCPRFPIKRWV